MASDPNNRQTCCALTQLWRTRLSGHISTKPSQIRSVRSIVLMLTCCTLMTLALQRYMVMKPMPKATKEIKELASKIYQRMVGQENEAIEKIRKVIEYATNDDCRSDLTSRIITIGSLTLFTGMAHGLASYFGDHNAVPGGLCGYCTFCLTGSNVEFEPVAQSIADPVRIRQILDACPERDDPRLLARMAFGITSPRLTYGKWSMAHPLFGSMVDTDFSALVAAFDAECKKAGYEKVETAAPARTSQKRTYSQAKPTSYGSGSSSYRGGRGSSSYKRGRGGRC